GAALDPAEFAQSLHESGDPFASRRTRALPQETDGRQLASLLRAPPERPHRRAAEQPDECTARFHSITSSARVRSAGGTSSPGSAGVWRLMNSSMFVDR